MSQLDTQTTTGAGARSTGRAHWPLYAAGAGVLGFVATMVLDGRTSGVGVEVSEKLFTDLSPLPYRLSMLFGYGAVVLLLLFAASWRRHVEPRLQDSTAAHLVPMGLLASAAGLTYGYGWKGALGLYMPGGLEEGSYDTQGLYVYYLLNDFGSFIGWLGVVVAAGAVAWMGLRERTVSRWIGVVSVLPVLQTTLMVVGLGVPGVPGLLAHVWLVVAGLGLALGRSTITR
ncbi:hypothetical protein DDE18_02040 [Nocardioides gansuensis]|uniref:Uncharacterized protein n=1 Tax=Nocardioides gansuensis TaxID=2138300 RepID=A0A2T8FFF3_9ACTN|nr:hypothetical protein [Nocardioides gansuensis]PVG84420.1 hypothetical protein DDE18_02040 [Nocardioides gansuensis]